ncbi:MAG: hypothetical protein ACAI44_32805 [Candidatus Sericytochromatia bacterium]
MRQLHYLFSALTLGLTLMLVILWMPYLIRALLLLTAFMAVTGLVAWIWFRHKLKLIARELATQMQQGQMPDRGEPGLNTDRPDSGPIIHIQPEVVSRRD